MLKRLVFGLILGAAIGAALAALWVRGLGMPLFESAPFAYLAAAVMGIFTGLVAGKPIWAADGKIEAGLKALFGVVLGVGGMFVLRKWGNAEIDLSMLHAGAGTLGHLPAASLPILGSVLAAFYEIDNSPTAEDTSKGNAGRKNGTSRVRVAHEAGDEDERADNSEIDDDSELSSKKKRR